MSRIEDALAKARAMGSLVVHSSARERIQPDSGTSAFQSAPISKSREVSKATQATSFRPGDIKSMRELSALPAEQLMEFRTIHQRMARDEGARAFLDLRTKILQKSAGKNCAVVVTSAVPHGGASFISRNLAVAFALDETKTSLLMDCNFVTSGEHVDLVPSNKPGLMDYLDGRISNLEDIIHPVGIHRMRVMPRGLQELLGSDYFTSPRMAALLNEITARYLDRYLIIDAPPVARSADARVLVDAADYVLLVAPYGQVTATDIADAIKAIESKKLLGVVFNNEPRFGELTLPELRDRCKEGLHRMPQRILSLLRRNYAQAV